MSIFIRKQLLTALIIFLFTSDAFNQNADANHFSTSNDTLFIEAYKVKGEGLFSQGLMEGNFKEISDTFQYPIDFPQNIQAVKRMQWSTDFGAQKKYYIDIIKGKKGDEQVFIVDENNNKNLTDDSIRILQPYDWELNTPLIESKYSVLKQNKESEYLTWLLIGEMDGELWCGKSEHLIAKFWIEDERFEVGVKDIRAGDFTFTAYPEIAILSHNLNLIDTLRNRDKLKLGEYLKLGDNYYKFEGISRYGDYITLVKDNDFYKQIGIQVGMIAPDFTCVTTSGDTISSLKLHDRPMVIANSCGCGGDKQSEKAYYDILNQFGNKNHILHLDSKINNKVKGLQVDMEDSYNKDIYYKYRNTYCSRICYVIDTNNRVIDRFYVTDWEKYLKNHL